MLTIQILIQNNANTIRSTLESISSLNARLVVGDLGSTDGTIQICREFKADIVDVRDEARHAARNRLRIGSTKCLWLEPWDIVVKGHAAIAAFDKKAAYVSVLQDNLLSHEVRLFDSSVRFINPVFERLDVQTTEDSPVLISRQGNLDVAEIIRIIEDWKSKEPFLPDPLYYHAAVLFSQQKYDDYLTMADKYLFMEKNNSQSVVMTRYYYALVQLIHKRAYKPALQNLNLCLCSKPLMAEFWCLMGDVYYHLLHKFAEAKEFYENAMCLGARRLREDKWPMDISKYKSYPLKMIESCKAILNHKDLYFQINRL